MDSAFSDKKFPAYTLAQLEGFVAIGDVPGHEAMVAEIARRKAVAAGDESQATQGERLRAAQDRHLDLINNRRR